MSYSICLLRFVDGELADLDAVRLRRMTEPYRWEGSSDEAFSRLRAEDGGGADLDHASDDGGAMRCVTATHFSGGAMSGVLVRLAAALGASIVTDGAVLIFHEDERRHLPADWSERAILIAPEADAFESAIASL
ncbi:hypothetical protein [Streptomyces sp. NPDC060198]|uniref:hypothetical protein n=1 Tax=Streptomyces sp. NPDC060198 TaxID=3347070 RepID=UPI0036627423